MRVNFIENTNGPERMVCEAEIVFGDAKEEWTGECPTCGSTSILRGMKLVGFSLWRSPEGEVYITFPSRAFGAGNERRYFDFLRSVEGVASDSKRIKAWILAEFQRQAADRAKGVA
jgi:hypothetical protein